MQHGWDSLIQRLHAADCRIVLAVAGDDAPEIAEVLADVLGAQSIVQMIEFSDRESLRHWLGCQPGRFCSRETALGMAVVAWWQAHRTESRADDSLVGAALCRPFCGTAGLDTSPGYFVATQTAGSTCLNTVQRSTPCSDFSVERKFAAELVLDALAKTFGMTESPGVTARSGQRVSIEQDVAEPLLADVWNGRRLFAWFLPQIGMQASVPERHRGLLSGSFNPLHEGHRQLREAAERRLHGPVYYEMSAVNADKLPLDYLALAHRCAQSWDRPVAFTRAATFAEKSRVLPGTTFVVGLDTAARILDPRFYEGREAQMHRALQQIRSAGCRFLVAGRKLGPEFRTIRNIRCPADSATLFEELPESEFRHDVSSTQLRGSGEPS